MIFDKGERNNNIPRKQRKCEENTQKNLKVQANTAAMRVFFLLSLEITIIGTKTETDGWMEANYSEPTNSKVKSSNYTRRQYGAIVISKEKH